MILGLSPMDGITDCSYREMCKSCGSVDLLYTEFQNVHGLALAVPKLWNAFRYTEFQRPVLAQIYGHEVEYFFPSALLCFLLGFDGVDINMGCPAKKISDRGAGAGLIRTPEVAKQIISEVKRARFIFKQEILKIISKYESYKDLLADLENTNLVDICDLAYRQLNSDCFASFAMTYELPQINWSKLLKLVLNLAIEWDIDLRRVISNSKKLTVSVKTRIGYDKSEVETWMPNLLETRPDFIAIHGRTLKQMYTGVADYNSIAKAVELSHKAGIPIFANGDIDSTESAKLCLEITKADGLLIGRGSYGKPEIFNQIRNAIDVKSAKDELFDNDQISTLNSFSTNDTNDIDKFDQILKHCEMWDKFSEGDQFFPMRKILCWYIKEIPNASELRKKLVLANSSEEVKRILEEFQSVDKK